MSDSHAWPADADAVIALLAELFATRGGAAYLGEDVSMAEHMAQAAHRAERTGAGDAVVAAALLHDIGHFHDAFTEQFALELDNRHQLHGAQVLARWLPAAVVEPVRAHVDAKRYLCAVERCYLEALSDASVQTLELQGGPMGPDEVRRFAARADLEAVLTVRRCDDAGKDRHARVPGFEHHVPRLRRLLAAGPDG